MKVSLLSNETNSQEPLAVHSRIFVGNLNTFQCSKSDVEQIFQRYGHLTGRVNHQLARWHCVDGINCLTRLLNLYPNKVMTYLSLYFPVTAISMHKGYAFVQFSNPAEAKNAADGEDGRLVLNQNIGKIQLQFACLPAQ